MVNIGGAASGLKTVGGGLFGKLFRVKWGYLIIIVLFIQAISIGINNGGGVEIIKSLGERFFNITYQLQINSLDIVNNNASFSGWLEFIKISWALFSSAYVIYLWLKLFYWAAGKSPISNESAGFGNILISVFLFYLLQVIYLLFLRFGLESVLFVDYGFWDMFTIPYQSFADFFHAIVLLFSSLSFENVIEPISNFTDSNICSDPIGCVI